MKKVYFILGLALLIISACMIYLVINGVSLRSEPIIKPSAVDSQYKNVTFAVLHRLFPDFQKTDYVVWGIDPLPSSEENTIFELLQNEYAVQFGSKPQLLLWNDKMAKEEAQKCKKPCWIILDKENANSLKQNPILDRIKESLGSNYFSLTFLDFDRNQIVPKICESEKRLDFKCLLPVSVREVQKYFKDIGTRYFFARAYNEIDYFIFLEKSR